jgi:lycopene beta-cyclase
LQHFKGRIIETPQPFFDVAKATLMDFRVHQQHGTAFVYIMPLSPVKALIEYTLFTTTLLPQEQYDVELNEYIRNTLQLQQYTIVEEELGVIPMTNARFAAQHNGVYNLGTAGGQTKASTGYTFQFIQKQAAAVVAQLAQHKKPVIPVRFFDKRFKLYDSTLLNILANQHLAGAAFFTQLYQRNKAAAIFKFLDNETSLPEELKIMNTVPRWLFTKTAVREMFRYYLGFYI